MHLLFVTLLALTQQWLIVSDLHVDPFDRSTAPAYYQRDTNWVLFDSTIAQMRKVAPQARVVIIDGDSLAHHFQTKVRDASPSQSVSAEAVATMARIERAFALAFPHAQFLFVMGNNDDPCGDYRTAPNTAYLAQLARLWEPLVNRGNASPHFVRDFSHAAAYTARLPIAGLRAVVVDDVYWSLFYRPCKGSGGALPQWQMSRLAHAIGAPPAGERSVVVLHIPPGIDPSTTLMAHRFLVVPYLRDDLTVRFTDLLERGKSSIPFVLAGHLHRNDFRLAGGVPILIAPSISPVYSNNPAFLTAQIDESGTLRDYQIHAYDLETDTWSQILDFRQAFGARDFTAASLAAVHKRIAEDDALRDLWERSLIADSREYNDIRHGWRAFWCAQTELRGGYTACAGAQGRVVALPILVALLACAIVAAVVFLLMRLARQRRRA